MNSVKEAGRDGGKASPPVTRRYQPYLEWDQGVARYLAEAFGAERFKAITEALCHPPKSSCLRVSILAATTQEVVRRLEQEYGVQERGRDAAFKCWEHELVPGVVMVGGSGPNEVKYTDCNGMPLPEILVSRKCGEAVLRGAEAFVPGILACEMGVNAGDDVAVSMFVENEGDPPTRGTTLGSAHETPLQPLQSCPLPTPTLQTSDKTCPCHSSESCSQSETSQPADSFTLYEQAQMPQPSRAYEASVPSGPSCDSQPPDCHPFSSQAVFHETETPHSSNGTDSSTPLAPLPPVQACQASQSRERWFIGRGKALLSRAAIFRQEQGVAVQMTHRVYSHPSLHALTNNWTEGVFLQHLPSVIAAQVLGPRPGERILDMCASPGGKTTAIAILMGNRGEIVALDRSHTKVQQIESLAAQMGLTCIKAFKMDATCCVQDCSTSDAAADKPNAGFEKMGCELREVLTDMTGANLENAQTAAAQSFAFGTPLEICSVSVAPSAESLGAGIQDGLQEVRVADGSECSTAERDGRRGDGLESPSTSVPSVKGTAEAEFSPVDTSAAPNEISSKTVPAGTGGVCAQNGCGIRQERNGVEKQPEPETTGSRPEAAAPNTDPDAAEPKLPARAKPSQPSTGGNRRGNPLERRAARKEARWLRSNQKRVKPDKLEPGSFDRVLLDAPCSALGLRPRLFVRGVNLHSLRQDGVYKRRFLDQAVQLVKPGGVIVYSTCTFNPGENEALVRYALDTYPCLRLVPQEPRLGGPGLVGGGNVFDGTGCREWLREGEQNLVQRFDPDSPLDTIGFFIVKFQKALLEA